MGINGRQNGLEKNGVPGARSVSAVTNLIKLGGLIVALNEALLQEPPDARILGVAAFMMAGAQGIESLLSYVFGTRK